MKQVKRQNAHGRRLINKHNNIRQTEIFKIMQTAVANTQAVAYIVIVNKKLNKAAQALGRLGGKAGTGKAKARTSEQARAAIMARWNKRGARKTIN